MLAKRILVLLVSVFAMSAWWLDSATASDCAPGPNADLANCDFSYADLANADLQGSNLSNADFASADLTNANLAGANVSGAKLSSATITNLSSGAIAGTPASLPTGWKLIKGYIAGPTANLTNADLSAANLTGVNLQLATLDGVKSGSITGTPTLPSTWRLVAGYLIGPKANLAGATLVSKDLGGRDLTDANLSGANLEKTYLGSAKLIRADLTNANLTSTNVSQANLTEANLTNANLAFISSSGSTTLTGANLTGIRSGGVTATQSTLGLPGTWNVTKGYIVGPTANLTGANLKSANLNGISLAGATLDRVSSGGISIAPSAVPEGWLFLGGYFIGPTADLTNANLNSMDLSSANIKFANFTGADVSAVRFSGQDLSQANLTGIKSGYIWPEPGNLPERWAFRDGFLVGPTANFTNVYADRPDFSNTDLVGSTFARMNLSGANLSGANLSNSTWSQTNIEGANLTDVNLTGVRSTTLSGTATFSAAWTTRAGMFIGPGANLRGATLADVDLSGVNLADADLTGALLIRIKSSSIVGVPRALPSDWRLENGILLGLSADLRNADLTGLDLRWLPVGAMQISGANFTNARIGLADFRDTDLTGVIFKNTDLAGIRCTFCNLSGIDFSGADLTGASLYKVNFSNANLRGTNFSNAWLDSANVSGADVTDASFSGANLVNLISGQTGGTPQALPSGWRATGGYWIGSGADLTNADLSGVNLGGLNLDGVTVEGALLSGANLKNLKMTGTLGVVGTLPPGWKLSKGFLLGPDANLSSLNLAAISLTGVSLSSANLQGVASSAIVGSPSALPSGWKMFRGQLVGPGANLTDASLTAMNLDGVSLLETTLVRVSSGGITGTPSALDDGWKLINGYLVGREANLANANFADQDLSGVNLWLADMSGSTLRNVKSGGITGIPANLPPNWAVVSGYLVGAGANLENADLANAELIDISLRGANLTGANLNRVLTRNVGCQDAVLPTNWRCIGLHLVGPTARLDSVKLSRLDFSLANLSGASLTNARIDNCDFRGANLGGANLSGANIYDSDFTQSILDETNLSGALLVGPISSQVIGIPIGLAESWVLASGVFLQLQTSPTRIALGEAIVGKDLVPTIFDAPEGAEISYQWLENGNPIATSTGSSISLSAGQSGKRISLTLTFRRAGYVDKTLTSSEITVLPGKLAFVTPKILGSALVGSTLSTETVTLDPETQFTIQWLENGNPKAGSTATKLTLTSTMANKEVSVRFSFTKPGFETLTLTTPAVKVGLGVLTAVTPKITGTAKVAKTLTAVSAKWASVATIQYQWLLDGKAIKGATKSTYKLLPTQKGRKISVQVTQVAAGYKSAVKISTALKVG